jgi:hypothetical protein
MNIFPATPGVYEYLIVHCTATTPTMDIGAAWVDRVHRRKGWSGCGYHVVITRSGEIQWHGSGHRTRRVGSPGAHVGGCGPGWNARSFGVSLAGGVKEDGRTPDCNFTDAQYVALWYVIEDACEKFGIPMDNVIGHRDLIKMTRAAPKACPCFSVEEFKTGFVVPLDTYDDDRLEYRWDRHLRPALQRGEKLGVKRQYIVKAGDTLWSISRVTGVPLHTIRRLNDIDNDLIRPGQKLQLLD